MQKSNPDLASAIARISRMERDFDRPQAAWHENPNCFIADEDARETLNMLTAYYESGQWLRDWELDEQGLLPPGLKRGILSEDALFNFLCDISAPFV